MSEIPTTVGGDAPPLRRQQLIHTRHDGTRVQVRAFGALLGTLRQIRTRARYGGMTTRWQWTPSPQAWNGRPPPAARAGDAFGACTTRAGALENLVQHLIDHGAPPAVRLGRTTRA